MAGPTGDRFVRPAQPIENKEGEKKGNVRTKRPSVRSTFLLLLHGENKKQKQKTAAGRHRDKDSQFTRKQLWINPSFALTTLLH